MMELFQTEWCRGSKRVRQRLTELGVDVIVRQVPADPDERLELHARTGAETVPTLLTDDGEVIEGTEQILFFLGTRFGDAADAELHRRRAERSRAKECEERLTAAG